VKPGDLPMSPGLHQRAWSSRRLALGLALLLPASASLLAHGTGGEHAPTTMPLETASGEVHVHPQGHGHHHDQPHPSQVAPSPQHERLLLDAYSDGSLEARIIALHQLLGARLDAHDDTGQTLLMKAATRADASMVQALLEAGASLVHTDIHGWSALEHAVQTNAGDAALALLAAGAKERVDHHENSTLQYAVNLLVDTRVVAALVEAGADVNRRSLDGLTVLMEAIDAGAPLATIRALLAAPSMDLAAADPWGEDALAHARKRGDADILRALDEVAGR
jgi:ankyrin repeat protein